MRNRLLSLIAFVPFAALLSACVNGPASEPISRSGTLPAQRQPASPPEQNQSEIVLNVSGGHYQHFETSTWEGSDLTVETTVERAADDEKWAPMSSVCVRAIAPAAPVCLKFALSRRGSSELNSHMDVIREDGKALLGTDRVEGLFRIGETITIGMHVDGDVVRFTINGTQQITHQLQAPVRVIRFACSTATCRFRLM